jgi:hypothetical protein
VFPSFFCSEIEAAYTSCLAAANGGGGGGMVPLAHSELPTPQQQRQILLHQLMWTPPSSSSSSGGGVAAAGSGSADAVAQVSAALVRSALALVPAQKLAELSVRTNSVMWSSASLAVQEAAGS